MTSSADGSQNVVGVLVDMAEVWELYLYHLLQHLLPSAAVTHTGRTQAATCLLRGVSPTDTLAALKPDIVARKRSTCLIVDAKYKLTTPSAETSTVTLPEVHQSDLTLAVGAYADVVSDDPTVHILLRKDRHVPRQPVMMQRMAGRGRHGLFTHHLLRGIKGEADSDRDGCVGLFDLLPTYDRGSSLVRETRFDRNSGHG